MIESCQTSGLHLSGVDLSTGSVEKPGTLDGATIMRYAPFYRERSNGGVEQCLRALNNGLLQRHRLTLLQVHRVSDLRNHQIEVEFVGKGRVVWIPVAYQQTLSRFSELPARAKFVYQQTIQQHSYGVRRSVGHSVLAVLRRGMQDLRHRTVVLSDLLCQVFYTYNVNLLALHGLTYDAGNLVRHAKRIGVPFVLVSHFDNTLFSQPEVRSWIPYAAGIGSVSGKNLPDVVRDRCVNLSDGIDTEFFAPEQLSPGRHPPSPAILLPALIKPGKGHLDLLQAARIMAARNLDFQVWFAGALESESLRRNLWKYSVEAGLEHRIVFLGELRQEAIRDCYAQSSVVVLPTYCEGLGRCLVEAQAMQKPVVAYDSGGVAETLLTNETGFLVRTGDVKSLADRIGYLLENEVERLRMGERGRQFVIRQFSFPALIKRHEAFYIKALSRDRTPGGSK